MYHKFDINKHIDSLPLTQVKIELSHMQLTYIPSLKRFSNLCQLSCSDNLLTKLPELPDSVQVIICKNNYLKSLPEKLPPQLVVLDCSHNPLVTLPRLPASLERLMCRSCAIKVLPPLPHRLK